MLFAIIAGLVFGISRLYNLDIIPIFADEAIYIRWAQLMAWDLNNLFVPLSDGKTPLFMWLLAPWLRLRFDPLLTGRLLSIAGGLLGIIGIYKLAQKLFETKTARLAVVLAILCPFLLFYDRLSLTDSWLAALIVWSVYFGSGIPLGIMAAAAMWIKPSALSYLLLIPLLNLKAWKKLFLPAGITFFLYSLLRFSDSFYMIKQRSLDYVQTPSFSQLISTSQVFSRWLVSYLDWPLVIVFLISLVIAAKWREHKIGILTLLILLPFLALSAVGKIVYPRYLLPMAPFMLIICAWGLARLPRFITAGLLAFILAGWIKFDYTLLTDPIKAPLHQAEKEQYFYTWASGYGLREVRQYLLSQPQDKKILVATEGSFGTLPNGLEIYFSGHPTIQILGVGFPNGGISAGMEQALQDGKRLFLVANFNRFTFPSSDRIKLIGEYPRPEGEKLMFYEIY